MNSSADAAAAESERNLPSSSRGVVTKSLNKEEHVSSCVSSYLESTSGRPRRACAVFGQLYLAELLREDISVEKSGFSTEDSLYPDPKRRKLYNESFSSDSEPSSSSENSREYRKRKKSAKVSKSKKPSVKKPGCAAAPGNLRKSPGAKNARSATAGGS